MSDVFSYPWMLAHLLTLGAICGGNFQHEIPDAPNIKNECNLAVKSRKYNQIARGVGESGSSDVCKQNTDLLRSCSGRKDLLTETTANTTCSSMRSWHTTIYRSRKCPPGQSRVGIGAIPVIIWLEITKSSTDFQDLLRNDNWKYGFLRNFQKLTNILYISYKIRRRAFRSICHWSVNENEHCKSSMTLTLWRKPCLLASLLVLHNRRPAIRLDCHSY